MNPDTVRLKDPQIILYKTQITKWPQVQERTNTIMKKGGRNLQHDIQQKQEQ
jgi:hypothetical protein